MKPSDFDVLLEETIKEIRTTLGVKSGEYTEDLDRLKNFKDAASFQEISPEQALMGMVSKHIIALKDFIRRQAKGKEVSEYQWREKTTDIINYMILLRALLKERGNM